MVLSGPPAKIRHKRGRTGIRYNTVKWHLFHIHIAKTIRKEEAHRFNVCIDDITRKAVPDSTATKEAPS